MPIAITKQTTVTAQPISVKPEETKSGEFLLLEVKAAPKPVSYCLSPANFAGYLLGVTGGCCFGIASSLVVPAAVNYAIGGALTATNYMGLGIFSGGPGIACAVGTAAYFSVKKAKELADAG